MDTFVFSDRLPPIHILSEMPGCDCIGNCTDPASCACLRQSGGHTNYQADSRLNFLACDATPHPVHECNSNCACQENTCSNRVVSMAFDKVSDCMIPKDVGQKGAGIILGRRLQRGEFLCIYAGEVVPPDEAHILAAKQVNELGHTYVLCAREFAGSFSKLHIFC